MQYNFDNNPMKLKHEFNECTYIIDLDYENDVDLLKIVSKKHSILPTELFKYKALDKFGIDSLLNNYLYASHPWELNDPFDCNRDLISFKNATLNEILELNQDFFDRNDIIKLYNSQNPKDKEELQEIISKLLYYFLYMKTGLVSMTTKNNCMEMWSYYTRHRGFVIKYDLKMLPKNYWGPFPINYTNDFQSIDYSKLKNSSFIYQTNVKASCWDHEDEWRLIFFGENILTMPKHSIKIAKPRKFYYNPNAVTEIILGYNFFELNELEFENSSQINQIIKLKENKKIKRRFIKYLIKNNINTSMITLRRQTTSELQSRKIKISELSATRYQIQYI